MATATNKKLIVTVDGVIGAGKTTTARAVAQALGYRHIDTGAFYRAVTLAAMRAGIHPTDECVAEWVTTLKIIQDESKGRVLTMINGEDVSDEIRRPEVSRNVGAFADLVTIRKALIDHQQYVGREGGVVADGRDAGTVIFPDADLKVVMTANLETRAQRRYQELSKKGVNTTLQQVTADIRTRDRQDSKRNYGATHGDDAVILDTTDMTIAQQVDQIVEWARKQSA